MSDYGRNFEWRIPPEGSARSGRYAVPDTVFAGNLSGKGGIPIGAPVIVDTAVTSTTAGTGLVVLKLAPQATPRNAGEAKGILLYEFGPAAFAGDDPMLTTYSDKDYAPPGAAVQLVRGDPSAKACFTNTVARSFLGIRPYPGRTMVLGIGATPQVSVGDFLTPGLGNDNDGYWQGTSDPTLGWFEITLVDSVRGQVEARMLF